MRYKVIALGCALIVVAELGEIHEGKPAHEHVHTHYDFQPVGTSAYLASGTSAGGVEISGDGLRA